VYETILAKLVEYYYTPFHSVSCTGKTALFAGRHVGPGSAYGRYLRNIWAQAYENWPDKFHPDL